MPRATPASREPRTSALDAFAARLESAVRDGGAASVERQLDDAGYARLPGLLTGPECTELAALFGRDDTFRKTIEMQRHAYGEGRYRYFSYPLEPRVARMRTALYAPLAEIANRWNEKLGIETRYPRTLEALLARCQEAGQLRPTPLLLRYERGGYNRMHRDVYGDVAFPLQVACLLSSPGSDFEGGEFLVSEGRARMQTRTTAVRLAAGDAIVFANAVRPVASTRGYARAAMRHGVSTVTRGERVALGIIFHDAQ
jgi:hypothetical protein